MRAKLIEILKCLRCGSDTLHLNIAEDDGLEVVSGAVVCLQCRLEYTIKDGILDAYLFPDPTVEAAREAYRKSKSTKASNAPENLANRRHLDREYLMDTEANLAQMLDSLDISEGWALDIGAGTGWTTAGLARKGFRAVAVDISIDHKLELAHHHFGPGMFFDRVLADMNRLPFKDRSFSLALSSAAMHHSRDLGASLNEVYRTMAYEGRLELINEPVMGWLEAWQPGRGVLEAEEGVLENHYGFASWMKYLKDTGFIGRARFPENIARRLIDGDFSRKHKFYRLARIMALFWSFRAARPFFKAIMFRPGMILLGLPLCYSGRKRKN